MKRLFAALAFALVAFAPFAHAEIQTDSVRQAGFANLTESQKATVLQQVAQMSANKDAAGGVTLDKADKWLNVGERIGKMFGAAAKEVGVAVNEFAKTPVGMLTMGLIVWNIMGGALMHLFGSVMIAIVGFVWVWWYTKHARNVTITYSPTDRKWFGFGGYRVLKYEQQKLHDGDQVTLIFVPLAMIVASMVALFTF